jgi:hypothetical protein
LEERKGELARKKQLKNALLGIYDDGSGSFKKKSNLNSRYFGHEEIDFSKISLKGRKRGYGEGYDDNEYDQYLDQIEDDEIKENLPVIEDEKQNDEGEI